MTNTTKAWLLCHPVFGYCVITILIVILAFFLNGQHLRMILNYEDENSNFIFYFWIIISPLLLARNYDTVGGLIFMSIGILCCKAMIVFCYFTDSTISFLLYVAVFVDIAATIWVIVRGVRIGKWTCSNMDEIIPRRMKWKNSKVDIYSLSLKYSINRGIANAFCAYNCVMLFILLIVIR
jgi:hypothetical protein